MPKDGSPNENYSGVIYFDKEKRFMTVSGEISTNMADTFFNTLDEFQPKASGEPPLPLDIYINSEGGEVYSVFKMCDHIWDSPCAITTIVAGIAFSAGLMLFIAGDRRLVFPHATLGFHMPYRYSDKDKKVDPYEAAADARYHQEIWEKIFKMFKNRMKISKNTLRSYFRASEKIDAVKAVELGLAHAIIEPKPKALPPEWQNLLNR